MEEFVTIDGAGRVVVPKAIRERLHLTKGSRLKVREDGCCLVIEPIPEECIPADVDGILVIRGRLAGEVPDHRAIRDQRTRHLVSSGR
jgi:AbrB family looped-hinge helix DNA binding protein